MARLDPAEGFDILKDRVKEAISDTFPQEGAKNVLELEGIDIPDKLSVSNVGDQKSAKMNGRTWGVPIHATLVLKDKKTGKILDRSKLKVATLPKITNRYSYIVDGSEYQVDNQWRLKPGVYTKIQQNGELDSFFNIQGQPMHVGFDPKQRTFSVKHGGAKPPLYPVMRALGHSDGDLEKVWGKDILTANMTDAKGKLLKVDKHAINFAKRLAPDAEVTSFDQASEIIKQKFAESKLHPDVTSRTLGKAIDKITPEAVLRSSKRLLGVARGDEKPDVRDSLMFKEFFGTEDFMAERLRQSAPVIQRRISNNIDRREKVRDIVGMDVFQRPVKEFFSKVSLASTPEQTNPLKMISGQLRTTIAGEGGVKDANRITEDAKLVDPSHFGVLDPLHTPESIRTGVNLQLSLGARKVGTKVEIPLINVKTGKVQYLDPGKINDSVVALSDSVKKVGNKFVPKVGSTVLASAKGNELLDVPMKDVQYVVPKSSQMFSIATNMVPFISSDSPNRATMAGRHMEQAIPLKDPEPPLVQSILGKRSFDELVGSYASHAAPAEGTVVSVGKDGIQIKGADKKVHTVYTYDHYPLNDKKGMVHSTSLVKPGDKVSKGQVVADTNFTKGGVYSPGKNLEVAYMPWRGYNFEDGVVISETAAQKLTSEHLLKKGLSTREAKLLGTKKYQAYYQDRLNKEQAAKLDTDGVVKPGMKVKPGDTLIAALAEQQLTTEEQKLKLLHKSLVKPYKDKAITWDEDTEGEVIEVNKRGSRVDVHIKTSEPMNVGDKMVGRHGNKGIVTMILPDNEMPKKKDGSPIEVIMNPIGTPGRMNIGQVLETAAAKIARKTGQPFKVTNFEVDNNLEFVENELKKHGLVDKEPVIDPKTGKEIPGIQVGPQYILKMEHQVGKKMAARSRDSYDRNLVPKGGGPHGAQALGALGIYSMLAHGAKANIREMQTYKCLTWSTKVITDHGMIEIGKIVNQKMDVNVLSFNGETSELEFKPILNHWKREMDGTPMVELTFYSQAESGVFKRRRIRCTHEHEIYDVDLEKVFAKDIDWAMTPGHALTRAQKEILVGSLLGDGSLVTHNGPYPVFQERHSIRQKEYLEFKADALGDFSRTPVRDYNAGDKGFNNGQMMCEWSTLAQPAFSSWKSAFYQDGRKVVPDSVVSMITPLALAIWFQDDGSLTHGERQRVIRLHTGSFGEKDRELLKVALRSQYGLDFGECGNNGSVDLRLGKAGDIDKFIEIVRPFIHPSMSYKIGGGECGHALPDILDACTSDFDVFPTAVTVKRTRPNLWEGNYLYNLEVEGNHNYFAGGILVGNSDKAQGGDNDDLWSALQAGEMLPPPRTSFAYEKFNSYLKAMGVNTEKDGNSLNLVPLTDKQVLEMSNGELKDAGRVMKMRTLQPEKGGLFDPKVTGGHNGTNWSHIKLTAPMPNPLFEKAVMSVAGIRGPQFDKIVNGEAGVTHDGTIVEVTGVKGATYGPTAVAHLLDKVDVKKDLAAEEARIQGLKGQLQNESRKRIKYLRALDKLNMKPTEAYMMKNVPVLPPNMRPIAVLDDGSLQTDDLNEIYKQLAIVNNKHGEFPSNAPALLKAPLQADIYDHLKALTGIGGTLNRKHPGILDTLSGREGPKSSFAQDVLIKRKQDMTMRSTIVPEPSLALDEAEIPRKAAKEMYKPFLVRELRRTAGVTPLAAKKMIDEDDPLAHKALDRVVQERPILLKRDPVLHKYGIQAFKPRLVEGKAIKIHPLVCSGFNADFDGDTMSAYVPITAEAVKEAEGMFPSRNLFSPATGSVMYSPGHESQVGLFIMADVGKKTNLRFKTKAELAKAVKDGKVTQNDVVTVGSIKTTFGRMELNDHLPKDLRGGKLLTDLSYRFTKKEQEKLFNSMAQTDKTGYPTAINKLKDIGNEAATMGSFSFGLGDFKVHKDIRDPVLKMAETKAARLNLNKKQDVEKFIDIYEGAMNEIDAKLKQRIEDPKHQNNLAKLEVAAGIKGRGYRQLTAAPILFTDAKGEVITSPVKKSYAEGLPAADYWAATSGGRKGAIQRVQSVSEPGYLTKQMSNSTMDMLVAADDCGTSRGVSLHTDEPDVIGRYTVSDLKLQNGTIPANTLLTPDILNRIKNAKVDKVVVRSPMRCTHGKGVCAKCMGLNENGKLNDLGTNVGIMATQSIGERGTQLAMKAFHSGGVYEGKESAEKSIAAGGLERAVNILNLPQKIKGSAVLSTAQGRVSRIEKDPAGGVRVSVGDKQHYVPADRKLMSKVRVGSQVKKGDPLTSGPVNPHELLPLTNVSKVQGHMAGELHNIYGQYGIKRRHSELMVRALSNVTKVENPGSHPDLLPGDFTSTSQIYEWNKKNQGAKPVVHTPVLRGVKTIPLDVQEDWMARLNHEHLKSTLVEAAQQGWQSNLHGLHPIPPLIHGAEFGKGTKKEPWSY